ncbi:2-polyprenyl-6-methoxyphenol hydroxylase [Virgibacillus subterraneus]|uniref:2-polyprenyl-6-methoxyphenol hydroxylase n=1 Tax=Virgibacillus subterraneus TaxID=621109 RepID=A0A1H9C0K5_9BACI|nr:FAD-dependent monooxygenase [Virgibacillus subterraneus]SEP94699.1 2-polyprenyl-6-methoxyphenol hydroxylase [Virgibacillus subterraneus]
MKTKTSVLIIGGGLSGLSVALFLAYRNIDCIVIEKHQTTSIQYKFSGISARSMELYRNVGIEDAIRKQRPRRESNIVVMAKNLADEDHKIMEIEQADTSQISPTRHAECEQDRLEPILKKKAVKLGADIRFNTEVTDIRQGMGKVKVLIKNQSTEQTSEIHASYVIAADGSNGKTREKLGVSRQGPGILQNWLNVIFDTDALPAINGCYFTASILEDINGTLVPREGTKRWSMSVQYFPQEGEKPSDYTDERCKELIKRGLGRDDVNLNIVNIKPWEAAAFISDKFVYERVFFIGDTAHVIPPTGGFSGNTGIHDAYNLAWKLESVIKGIAGAELLNTYGQERQPIAYQTMQQALARLQAWFKDPSNKLPPVEKIIPDNNVVFGYRYQNGCLIHETGQTNQEVFEDVNNPTVRPGGRAPHLNLENNGQIVSTIDLFLDQWVVLTGVDGEKWENAIQQSKWAKQVRCYRIGQNGELKDYSNSFRKKYDVGMEGAVLIRPDGFIAWRSKEMTEHPNELIHEVFNRLLFVH